MLQPIPPPEPGDSLPDEPTRELEVAPASMEDDARDSLYLRESIVSDELPPGTRVGRYSVTDRLGEGGMGVVYKAWDPKLERMVALKVLRTARTRDAGPSPRGLQSEAQTLAKIEHANIVTIYDADFSDTRVFIAMELCSGQTLRQWLAAGRHGVQEIVDVFVAAGRGLAAAHRVGIVHRDFKPANVLIGEDGVVKVADFGMARLVELAIDEPIDSGSTWSTPDHDHSVSTIVGTPAYMAPEQLLGRLGDHRMDQFSFCLCLYWALLGAPPFPGGRAFQERRRVVPLGLGLAEHERLHRARQVPVRIRRALLRGLSVDPDERFDSMDALLVELEERRRWPWLMSVGALVMGLGLGALAMWETPQEPCEGASTALEDTWGAPRREALGQAVRRTHHPAADEQLGRVTAAFDGYANEWLDSHADACRATYVDRLQSEMLFDLRMRCLERRRSQLDVAIETMAQAEDAKGLDDRMPLPFKLPAIDECDDTAALERGSPLPLDPEARARIDLVVRRIDHANALREAGAGQEGLVFAEATVEDARSLDEPTVLAQALECLGRAQAEVASPKLAEQTLREALSVGTQGFDDQLVARAWPSLIYALVLQHRLEAGESMAFAAELAVERSGDELARGWLLNNLGILYGEKGDIERAVDHLQRALGVKSRLRGAKDFDVGITWINLGFVLANGERWSEASDAFAQAQAILDATVGPTHPLSDLARTGSCRIAVNRNEYEVALALCTEALSRLEVGSTSPALVSRVQVFTAKALLGVGRTQEALDTAERARERVEGLDARKAKQIDDWISEVRTSILEVEDTTPEESGS